MRFIFLMTLRPYQRLEPENDATFTQNFTAQSSYLQRNLLFATSPHRRGYRLAPLRDLPQREQINCNEGEQKIWNKHRGSSVIFGHPLAKE